MQTSMTHQRLFEPVLLSFFSSRTQTLEKAQGDHEFKNGGHTAISESYNLLISEHHTDQRHRRSRMSSLTRYH